MFRSFLRIDINMPEMTPYVSIVVPTIRVGGLDVLLNSLNGQTFKNFELILIDGIFDYRHELISNKLEKFDFKIVHKPPFNNPFPINSFCKFANTGLVHANGEIVLFVTDYTWLLNNCVEIHANFHKSNNDLQALMCPHNYFEPPTLKKDFPIYKLETVLDHKQEQIDIYIDDLKSGKLNNYMWSIFEQEFSNIENLHPDQVFWNTDPKLTHQKGCIQPIFFHAKNESCKLEKVMRINGWDEDLDGSHCYQDSDLAERLSQISGLNWHCDPTNIAYIINPRKHIPRARRLRPIETNHTMWMNKKLSGYPTPNSWSLIEKKQQM